MKDPRTDPMPHTEMTREQLEGALMALDDMHANVGLSYVVEQWLVDKRDAYRAKLAAMPPQPDLRAPLVDAYSALKEFIDNHGITCDCCRHVLIDVTSAIENNTPQHCVAGDSEGYGSACAYGMQADIDSLIADSDRLRERLSELQTALVEAQAALERFAIGGIEDCLTIEEYCVLREKIVNWHGPTEYIHARAALARIDAALEGKS